MDILKAEIERKRKQIQDTNIVPEGKKYFKRSELIAKHEEDYLKKHAPQKLLELEKYKHKYQASNDDDGDGNADGEKSSRDRNATSSKNVEALPKLSRREVIRRLRERGEPITLFAENELEAYRRLRKLEILEPEVNRGLRNDLQAALEQVDQAYLDEILKTTASVSAAKPDTGEADDGTGTISKTASALAAANEKKKPGDVHVYEDNLTFDEVVTMAKETFKNKKDLEGHAKMILTWVKFLMKTWGQHLNAREEFDKLSTSGKLASATYTQTAEYLRPLMRKLKTNTLTDDILEALSEIVLFMLDKEYIKANDAYLEMAIGNAPWPIGVTMVGIHARTGREKIFSKNVAHVMNDETQRKYIQGLKRLMTKCQIMFPTNPSKCVEYTPDATINS